MKREKEVMKNERVRERGREERESVKEEKEEESYRELKTEATIVDANKKERTSDEQNKLKGKMNEKEK